MKKILIIFSIFLSVLTFVKVVDARSGCCSHHGGVCGCGCCDGTSLSATCAPYYPECSSPLPRIYCGDNSCNGAESCSSCPVDCGACTMPKVSPQINATNNLPDQNSGVVAGASTEKDSSGWVWWILGIFGIGIVAYQIGKKKSNK